jgi:hypothetical protein
VTIVRTISQASLPLSPNDLEIQDPGSWLVIS